MKKFKRKKVFIDKNFQVKFILKALLPVVGAVILLSGMGLWQISYLRANFHFNSFNEMIIKISPHIEKIGNSSQTLFDFLQNILILSSITLLVLMVIYVSVIFLYLSHRIAGPVFRFNESFDKLREGDLTEKIVLREKDEFKELAISYNSLSDFLQEKVKKIHKYNLGLDSTLASLKEKSGDEPRAEIEKIEKNIKNISKTLNQFKFQ